MQCAEGMVGIINPNDMMNLDDYKKKASGLAASSSPINDEPYGGELVDAKEAEDDKEFRDDDIENERKGAAGIIGAPLLGLAGAVGFAVMMA